MSTPTFYLQISDPSGVVIKTSAGGKHERDLIDMIVDHVMIRGVGFFKTSNHVEQDLRDGIAAAILEIKVKNPFDVVE